MDEKEIEKSIFFFLLIVISKIIVSLYQSLTHIHDGQKQKQLPVSVISFFSLDFLIFT